jgi:riboflavin kinase/FMN adenylyltransferase
MSLNTFTATVLVGTQVARTLGFPTANLWVPDALLLNSPGVYAGTTVIDDYRHEYNSCVFIDTKGTLEAHCIGVRDLELYGREITVTIHKHVRGMMDFTGWTLDQIKDQLAQDVRDCEFHAISENV